MQVQEGAKQSTNNENSASATVGQRLSFKGPQGQVGHPCSSSGSGSAVAQQQWGRVIAPA